MMADMERVLLTREQIAQRVDELGWQITQDYRGGEPLLVGILKGAVVFYADLVRAIRLPVHFDFMGVSSYGAASISTGVVQILKDLDTQIQGRDVLLVEDIVDTGLTLSYLRELLLVREPKSLRIACLLDKPARRRAAVEPDYCGFSIVDEFVVGYGLDYNGRYRNLPDVCVLRSDMID